MKKLKSLLIFILLPFVLAGCLQVETTLNVKKDGSGTINEKVLFSKTFVKKKHLIQAGIIILVSIILFVFHDV